VLNRTYFRKGKSKESALAGGITGSMKLVTQTVVDKLEIQEMYFKICAGRLGKPWPY
jgi:hypothetical protein